MTTNQYFRAGVGIVVLNTEGQVLGLERIDIPEAWQFPQGGIEDNETLSAAAYRELEEETGLDASKVEYLAEYPDWITYELPPELRRDRVGRGQTQKWFVFRFTGVEADIRLDGDIPEFSAFAWMTCSDLVRRVPEFRRATYETLNQFVRTVS